MINIWIIVEIIIHLIAMASVLPPPEKMDLKGDLRGNWQFFKTTWVNYAAALELAKKAKEVQVGTLLSVMGKDCLQVFMNLPMEDEDRKDPAKILDKLSVYFEGKQYIIYERYLFNSISQEKSETFDQFVNRLRDQGKDCAYEGLQDQMIRDRIVIGITDNGTRARMLREADLTLERALALCRASELATLQLQKLNPEVVNFVKKKDKKPIHRKLIKN